MPSKRPCNICPHHCRVEPGQWGRCKVRLYGEQGWENPYRGIISSSGWDPIEKKPLYHYKPGEQIFSVGFWGCNMKCPYCQNWQISQQVSKNRAAITPKELLDSLPSNSLLAFTYNEPLIHSEYILETAQLAKDKGVSLVLVSNGMVSRAMALELFPLISACNFDLKCFNEKNYEELLGGNLKAVKQNIELAHEHCHVEITSLLVPGVLDSLNELDSLCSYLADLDKEMVLHLSRYFPAFNYHKPATTVQFMGEALETARKHLMWVYPGNIAMDSSSYCPNCGEQLVERQGYSTRITGLTPQGTCSKCRSPWKFVL